MSTDPTTNNPLVDGETERSSHYTDDGNPFASMDAPDADSGSTGVMAGVTSFEAGWAIAQGIDEGDWKIAVSGLMAAGLDLVSAATDPIAFVAGQLFSWMLEHIEPAREALEKLTGNPDMVNAYAKSWTNVEREMKALSAEYQESASGGTSSWQGKAGDAYRAKAEALSKLCDEAAAGAHGISGLTQGMGEIVTGVRTAVRDLLADIAGSLVSWAIEIACSVGTATPLVVGQATSKIARVVAKVADMLRKVGEALGGALRWLVVLRDLWDGLIRSVSDMEKSAASA